MNTKNKTNTKLAALRCWLARLVRKCLCKIGWHEWTWKYESGTPLDLNAPPPDHAKCAKCNAVYNAEKSQANSVISLSR